MRAEELKKRRMILDDHLNEIYTLQPVMSQQAKPEFENSEQLCEAVNSNELGYIPVDPSKCEVVIPPVIVKKMTTLMIMLKNKITILLLMLAKI